MKKTIPILAILWKNRYGLQMPHLRSRYLLTQIKKRLKLWPVLGLVGIRQCGKSTLLRNLLPNSIKGRYLTMDSVTARQRAVNSPESFTALQDGQDLFIVDEVQKVPALFDSIKLHVDEKRRPGMYIISGSTEFSQKTGIRESLTGRIGILHLYPMTAGELHQQPQLGSYFLNNKQATSLSLTQFDQKLSRGGLPGLCFLKSDDEFASACDIWLETTCHRDLTQVVGKNLSGTLALEILMTTARSDEPTLANMARTLKKDARIVAKYLDALVAILVMQKLEPHQGGVGKAQYWIADTGLASHLGASRQSLIKTNILMEALAHFENAGLGCPIIKTYRNEKTSRVPLVFEWPTKKAISNTAVAFFDGEAPTSKDMECLWSFAKRAGNYRLLFLTQTRETYKETRSKTEPSVEVFSLRA